MTSQHNDQLWTFNPDPFHSSQDDTEGRQWVTNVAAAERDNENEPPTGDAIEEEEDKEEQDDELEEKGSSNFLDPKQHNTAASGDLELDRKKTAAPDEKSFVGIKLVKSAARTARKRLHLHSIHATGPSKYLNPTNVRVHVKWGQDHGDPSSKSNSDEDDSDKDRATTNAILNDRAFLWRSRDNRKGRNSIAVPTSAITSPATPLRARFTFSVGQISANVFRMFTTFPYWNMAFWSGWAYTIGSVLFVMDGSWAFEDYAFPGSVGTSVATYGGPLCFFIGALFYELGAVMAYLEAVNDGSFQGSAMRRFLEGNEEETKKMVDEKLHTFFAHFVPHLPHHKSKEKDDDTAAMTVDPEVGWRTRDRHERPGSIYPAGKEPGPRRGAVDHGGVEEGTTVKYMTWRWFPSWQAMRHHHVREIGYLACAIQLFGATLYAITGVVNLPGILSSLKPWQTEGAYWVPQIVASMCFLTASLLFTLETQEKWWKIEPTVLGWWIGAWATLGSVGFLWIGIFGAASYDIKWAEYQADLASIWGSTGYLISSFLQWYEAVNKHPIDELFNEPGEMKSYQVHPI